MVHDISSDHCWRAIDELEFQTPACRYLPRLGKALDLLQACQLKTIIAWLTCSFPLLLDCPSSYASTPGIYLLR